MSTYAKLKDPVGKCKVLEYVSGAAVTAGTMSVVNGLLVYNLSGASASGQKVKAVYETHSNGLVLPKQASLAINAGEEVWWDTSASEVDKTNSNVNLGFCVESALAADTTVRVTLMNQNVG